VPPENVWYGTTVEDQERTDRIRSLVMVPARVRFLSCEPLLGPLDLEAQSDPMREGVPAIAGIDWVIVGGESGHHSRVFDIQWARDIRDQCRKVGAFVFIKQLGSNPDNSAQPDGSLIQAGITDSKGGDWSEWPTDLRVRELPSVA
jgi:protein gp37